MDLTRRDALAAMAAFALMGQVVEAQAVTAAAAAPEASLADPELAKSKVFRFKEMKVTQGSNGGWSRPVVHGTIATGEFVELHETMLPPGKMPHPPHQHRNSEFLLIRQGKLEYLNEGVPEPVEVGDVIYSASNRMHGLKNVGDVDAMYFVVSISHGQL
jgi:quercetin dioxygenase-like cupin family protein